MRLAYQGEPGAYSEAAALVYGGQHIETVPCKAFDDVFDAVVKKRATHGVVPLENSIGGTIHRNYDLLLEHWPAVWMSLAVSMLAHFAIGAARSIFTGRSVWASGRDMFVVGFGVAAIGYVIGELITRVL